MLITAVALCLLNLIAAVSTRNLVFRSNAASMQDKAQLVASSLAGLDELTQERVAQTMEVLADLRSTRVVVTDASGRMVYDSRAEGQSKQVYFLLPEVVQALEGNDVFYCQYTGEAVESHAAAPVLYYDAPMGAVYLMAYDTDQGTLIASLEGNLLKITVLLELAVILISLLFSSAFSRRMNRVLDSIRTVRAGDYTHQLEMTGHDEVSQLAQEFNELTDRLHESEQLRRRFVSDASHELKTPLASIKLLADSILQNEMDSETVREFVADISTEADRLTRLSVRLLELTKLDAQVMQPREVVDVSGTVRQVLKMLRPQLEQQHIEASCDLADGATILATEDDLYQIVFNLAENGIKYNRPGGALLLQVERRDETVILTVADTGIGIPDDAMAHIFERFYRVDKARSRQAGGTGLGLSIVHDMAERHFGTIEVAHRDPVGTRFRVTFPLFAVEEEPE